MPIDAGAGHAAGAAVHGSPIDSDLLAIEIGLVGAALSNLAGAGKNREKLHGVAADQGEMLQLFRRDGRRLLTCFRDCDLTGGCTDRDGLTLRADRQFDGEGLGVRAVQNDSRGLPFHEALGLDCHIVCTDLQIGDREIAGAARRQLTDDVGARVLNVDIRSGNHGSIGVRNVAGKSCED